MNDQKLELQLISYICMNREFVDVPVDYFYNTRICGLYRELRDQYYKHGTIERGAADKIYTDVMADTDDVYSPVSIDPVVAELGRYYRIREAKKCYENAINYLEAKPKRCDEIILKSFNKLSEIQFNGETEDYGHDDSVRKWMEKIEKDAKNGNKLKGFSSGMALLDKTINGWQQGLCYVIGGLKKTGKTRFAIDLANSLLKQGIGGCMFSMEMSANRIHTCMMSRRTGINSSDIGTNRIAGQPIKNLMIEANYYMQAPIYLSTKSAVDPKYVRTVIKKQKMRHDVRWCIVDYIQRMKLPGLSRTEEVEQCALQLADIGRDEDVVMIILSQLSGEAEKKTGDKPIYAFFKNSQAIIEACDVAIGLDNPNRGKAPDKDYVDIDAVILQRDGESDVMIPFKALLQFSQFEEKGW